MQGRTDFASRRVIAALALSAAAIALVPASHAAPADTCLSAPKGVAPQGSHWYYRIERSSNRKCWYLADKGQKVARRAAPRPAPRAQDEDEEQGTSAPAANPPAAPVASTPAAPVATEPSVPVAEPKPVITTLMTRNVSNAEQTAQVQAPAAAALALTLPAAAPSPAATEPPAIAPEQASNDRQAAAPAQPAPPPAAAAAEEKASTVSGPMPTLQLLLAAIALLGLLASVGLFVMSALRRRNDVLNRWQDTAALPFEESPETAAEEAPPYQPVAAHDPIRHRDLEPMRQRDDVDEILHRLARRRRAA